METGELEFSPPLLPPIVFESPPYPAVLLCFHSAQSGKEKGEGTFVMLLCRHAVRKGSQDGYREGEELG